MKKNTLLLLLSLFLFYPLTGQVNPYKNSTNKFKEQIMRLKLQLLPETSFRFPCGDSLGRGSRITQGYQDEYENYGSHLAIDVSNAPGDADLGDPLYSVANGIVSAADTYDYLTIYYKYQGKIVKALYYHCDTIFVKSGDWVKKGQIVATMGNSGGAYLAHLHFEIMLDTNLYAGFYGDPKGFMDPLIVLPYYDIEGKNQLLYKPTDMN